MSDFSKIGSGSVPRKTVSILLANFNHAAYLSDSLSGICGQDRAADEIIIVDDGSTDNSLEIIRAFQKKNPSIKLLINGENRGVQYSIGRALEAATKDFVVWAAADDLLLPNFIAENMSLLEENDEARICFSRLATFKDDEKEITSFNEKNNGLAFDFGSDSHFVSARGLQERLEKSYLWLSSNTAVMGRKEILALGGFPPELKWHSDWFSVYSVALRFGVCLIPDTLAAMRVLPETYSSAGMQNETEQLAVMQEMANFLAQPEFADLRQKFRTRPCLFSPMGERMLRALRQRPRDFDLYLRYLTWHLNHIGSIMRAQSANDIPRKNLKKFVGLLLISGSRLLDGLTPSHWKTSA